MPSAAAALLAFALIAAGAPVLLDVEPGRFSDEIPGHGLPAGWRPFTFEGIPRHTRYELVSDDHVTVVQATAEASASGLVKVIELDPKKYPVLRWRWKIANLIAAADPRSKAGDDYPARLYITFKLDPSRESLLDRARSSMGRMFYGTEPPYAGLNYIWERQLAIGTILSNIYTDRVQMIVVESGSDRLNQWVTEERNVYEDFKRAFGEEPPPISGIAIMTDSDNTGESARAWYGDISFHRGER